jgi:hypothetical protein
MYPTPGVVQTAAPAKMSLKWLRSEENFHDFYM